MRRVTAFTGLGLALAITGSASAGERVRLSTVPQSVLEAVRTRFKDARLTGADRETRDGKAVYEIAIRHEGRSIDVTATPAGVILLIKKQVVAKDLPDPVTRALETTYPGATYKELEEVVTVDGPREQLAHYEVSLVTAQRRTVEVHVSADGQIVREAR